MPGMSGRELSKQLCASHPQTRVLFLSGYTEDAIVHQGVLEPGTTFLQKPFTLQMLSRKVREVLRSPRK
jgi:two-component system cell cycle sensor histidine kinase/response regulator CckA